MFPKRAVAKTSRIEECSSSSLPPSLPPSLLPFKRISRCGRSGAGERPGCQQQRDTMTKAQLLLRRRQRRQKDQLSAQAPRPPPPHPPPPPPPPPPLSGTHRRILEVHITSLIFNSSRKVKVERRRFCVLREPWFHFRENKTTPRCDADLNIFIYVEPPELGKHSSVLTF